MRMRWRWRTYRPGSYSVDAIGESSQWMVTKPSNERCCSGRTIFASTCASTLHGWGDVTVSGYGRGNGTRRNRVLPNEHSTWPSSGPKERSCGRAWRKSRPSRRVFWSRAAKKKSFSGIDGDGGRMKRGNENRAGQASAVSFSLLFEN